MLDEKDFLKIKDFFSVELEKNRSSSERFFRNEIRQVYTQLESLVWLKSRLKLKSELPPLRGWPMSPDILLKLHQYITNNKPKLILELGSGASTLVIADALRQNGFGKLISIDHIQKYSNGTLALLQDEFLTSWVDVRVADLERWNGEHLISDVSHESPLWYSISLLEGIEDIDLMLVDGPPESTCSYARYPALPALHSRLSPEVQIWMDDANRKFEKEICLKWAGVYDFEVEKYPLDKGLAVLKKYSPA